jgi:methionyl-tRNA formyltransferase
VKFGFVTCVHLGLECMEEIYSLGGTLDLVITLPDDRYPKKSGRAWPGAFCREFGIPLVHVANINDAVAIEAVRAHEIDWLYVIGWSQIVHSEALAAPRRGAVGMHPTLLPVGRGRAPIPWAILLGLDETGVTMFQLDEGVDTGPIIAQERLPIAPEETATTLYRRVAHAHRSLIGRAHPRIADDAIVPIPQDESRASVWPGRRPEDGRIAPSMTRAEVDRLVRATTRPYPGAFWTQGDEVLRVWAGRPLADGGAAPVGARSLTLADGVYAATDWTYEAL